MLDIWSSSKTLLKIHTYMRTFHISHWLFLPCTRGPVRVHGDAWVGVGRFDMTNLLVQKKRKKKSSVWSAKLGEKIPNKQPKNCPV